MVHRVRVKLPFAAGFLVLLLAGCATLNNDDSRFVKTGDRTGYYLVRPTSPLRTKLGYDAAPYEDTAVVMNRGYGYDVLCFRFNTKGVLSEAPAYIAQMQPEPYYTIRLGSLIVGKSTLQTVEQIFGQPRSITPQPGGGSVVYIPIRVYNPFDLSTSMGRG